MDGVAVIVKVVGVGFGVGSEDCKGVGNPFEGKVFGRSGVGVVDKSTCAGVVVTDAESDNAEFSFCELHPNKSSSTMPSPHSLITAGDFIVQLNMPLVLLLDGIPRSKGVTQNIDAEKPQNVPFLTSWT
ncbi:MAG: hypothetical protein IIB16_10150 [Chloroflexi bacterium]|nr:hypothetical protein [Chloroflexota bacterium]